MLGPHRHRDALVGRGNPIMLIPVRARRRGGAENVPPSEAQLSGSALPEWSSSARPSNTRKPDHQSACETRTEQRGSRRRFLNFARVSVIEMPPHRPAGTR